MPQAPGTWEVAGSQPPRGSSEPAPHPPPQMYAYASSVFLEAGVPQGKVQYAIIGTGCCELFTAFVGVSITLGCSSSSPDTLRTSVPLLKPFPIPSHSDKTQRVSKHLLSIYSLLGTPTTILR